MLRSIFSFTAAILLMAPTAAAQGRRRAPRVDGFYPVSGQVGTQVLVVGRRLSGAYGVAFGRVRAAFRVQNDAMVVTSVPAGAVTGPITVLTREGRAVSAAAFTVDGPAPTSPAITSFTPAMGPVGTAVLVKGSGFTAGATAAFNGTPAEVAFLDASQLRATVPAGATTGPITVTTAGGAARSATSFTVQGTVPGVNLSLGGWYLSQSVQTLARSVPLVAGRDALLRVFPLAGGVTTAKPPVRVTITGGSPSPWVQILPAPQAVPAALDEGNLGASWNLKVPAAVLAPGATLKLELDPAGAFPDADRGDNVVQASLDLRTVKPFKVTVIPVTQQTLVGNLATGRDLASWVERLRRTYPLADLPGSVEVVAGAPYTTQANLNSGSDGWGQLLTEIERKRTAEANDRYYYGVVNVSYAGGLAGLGYIGRPSAIGWDKNGSYPDIFAHEVGHNFGRRHAPCGGAAGADPSWPADDAHADGRIGVYGIDLGNMSLVTPLTHDLMSYCQPPWASDYTYKGVLAFRAASSQGLEAGVPPAARECLLVSGRERDGKVSLDPAFTVTTRPSPPLGSEFALELLDGLGGVLRRVPFTPVEVADLDGAQERHFTFALPLCGGEKARATGLRVVRAGSVLAVRRAGYRGLPTPPVATPAGEGQVRLTWNALQAPDIMVRDARDGSVLAFASGGMAELATQARELVLELSNGVESHGFKVSF